jgi:hypothetical protein
MNATISAALKYIAPGNSSANVNLAASVAYVGESAGFLDIPEGTADGASFAVPFGSVAAPKLIALQNNTATAKEIAINASEDVWTLGAGDLMILGGPAALGITSVSVIETALSEADGNVSYVVLGDSATP